MTSLLSVESQLKHGEAGALGCKESAVRQSLTVAARQGPQVDRGDGRNPTMMRTQLLR